MWQDHISYISFGLLSNNNWYVVKQTTNIQEETRLL